MKTRLGLLAFLLVHPCFADKPIWLQRWTNDPSHAVNRALACVLTLVDLAGSHAVVGSRAELNSKARGALTRFRNRVLDVERRDPGHQRVSMFESPKTTEAERRFVAQRVAGLEEDLEDSEKPIVAARLITDRDRIREVLEQMSADHVRLAELMKLRPAGIFHYLVFPPAVSLLLNSAMTFAGITPSVTNLLIVMGGWIVLEWSSHTLGNSVTLLPTNPWNSMLRVLDEGGPRWSVASDNYAVQSRLITESWQQGQPSPNSLEGVQREERSQRTQGFYTNAPLVLLGVDIAAPGEEWVQTDYIAFRDPDSGEPRMIVAARSSAQSPRESGLRRSLRKLEQEIHQATATRPQVQMLPVRER